MFGMQLMGVAHIDHLCDSARSVLSGHSDQLPRRFHRERGPRHQQSRRCQKLPQVLT